MLVGLILGFTILGLLWYFMTRLPPSYPPTPPIRLPILGHFHNFLWIRDSESNSALYKMFKRYSKNDVLTLHIGTERMTMIGKISDDIDDISKIFTLNLNHVQGHINLQGTCYQVRQPIQGLIQKL